MLEVVGPPGAISSRTLQFIEMIGDAFICSKMDGSVISANDAACRMLGYSRAELTSLARDQVVAPGLDRERMVAERARTGWTRGKLTLIRKNGERFEAETASFLVTLVGEEPQLWIVVHDLIERRRVEEAHQALRESMQMLRALAEAAFEAILVHSEGKILLANRAAEEAAGVGPGELVGRALFDFVAPGSREQARIKVASGDERPYEAFGLRADGTIYPLEVRVRNAPVQLSGVPARVVAVRDLTARKQLEEDFRQAQKMEAVGRLAGGVAHDFNNMLVVILSGVELALGTLSGDHPARGELEEVKRAGLRAKELTRDLLAFGRKQLMKVRVVEVGAVVADLRTILTRLIPEDVRLAVDAQREGLRARLDESQLEIVMINLVVNARDAMPQGGRLDIRVDAVDLDAGDPQRFGDLQPGPYVRVVVADDGIGMDTTTTARVFEPFFTTKAAGQGTGLGLSTVFGIVKQSGGHIAVESEIACGSTFTVLFPRTADRLEDSPEPSFARPDPGSATVLVVEDEDAVRRVAARCLRAGGYEVLEAPRPEIAVEIARTYPGRIDALVTDVVMPEMSGRRLADLLVEIRPGLRVLYVSGYTADAIAIRGMLDADVNFLQKPFTGEQLCAGVADVLR